MGRRRRKQVQAERGEVPADVREGQGELLVPEEPRAEAPEPAESASVLDPRPFPKQLVVFEWVEEPSPAQVEEPAAQESRPSAEPEAEPDAEPEAEPETEPDPEAEPQAAAPEPGPGAERLSRARGLTVEGRLDEAAALYCEIAEEDPFSVKARNNLGVLYDELGHHEAALEQFEAARSLAIDSVEVLVNLGSTLGALGRFDEAERELRRAQNSVPTRLPFTPRWVSSTSAGACISRLRWNCFGSANKTLTTAPPTSTEARLSTDWAGWTSRWRCSSGQRSSNPRITGRTTQWASSSTARTSARRPRRCTERPGTSSGRDQRATGPARRGGDPGVAASGALGFLGNHRSQPEGRGR